jgi:cyclopropane fatty-acyl-phospholipid synthase-like methyltransferase
MKYLRGLLLSSFLALPLLGWAQDPAEKITCQIVYVPTGQAVVEKMLEMAKVTKNDIVFDLGCGDGRIVCTAAKKYGAKGMGIDIDPKRIQDCMETMKKFGVTKEQVEIRQGDALKVKDLDRATVITFYMLPEFMEKLEPQIKKLKPGTRLVAHDYPFPNLEPDQVVEFDTGDGDRPRSLYLWTIKEKKK